MERVPFLVCDERQREVCKHGPHCEHLEKTRHHVRPRRLGKIALEEGMSEDYRETLKQVIRHPKNILIVPRCYHDLLDELTSDTLPPEEELEQTLEVWNRKDDV